MRFSLLDFQWNLEDAKKARYADGYEEGFEKGIEFVALNMIRQGEPFEEIQACTDLSIKRIEELAALCKD